MDILVACEWSGVVRDKLIHQGHEVVSCDLEPGEGEFTDRHYQGDVLKLFDEPEWDMMIAFPPCTYLCVSGNRWYADDPRRQEAFEFFMKLANAPIKKIAIENPVGVVSSWWRKPDQYVHPYYFGDPYEKKTGLWLKNLPPLTPTNMVEPPPRQQVKGGKSLPEWYSNAPKQDRGKFRGKTFQGLANAMADQWG